MERERMRNNRPKNVIAGIGGGAQSLANGVFKGVTGVFTQPFEGAKRDGISGLCKGLLGGFVGLVAKPTAGVLDFASQTSVGIKSTVRTFDDKANELKQRFPRVFYGRECFFRSYIEHDSKILKQLFTMSNGKFSKDHFLQSFLFTEIGSKSKFGVVLLTCEHIIYFDYDKKIIRFAVEPGNIKRIDREEDGIIIRMSENEGLLVIKCSEQEIIKEMVSSMSNLRYIALSTMNLSAIG